MKNIEIIRMLARKLHTPTAVQRVRASNRTQCDASTDTDPRSAYRIIPATNVMSDQPRKTAGSEGRMLIS